MPLSAELQELYATPSPYDGEALTLAFDHATLVSPIYVTNQPRGFQATLEDLSTVYFQPIAFAIEFPKRDDRGRQDLQIAMDNIGRTLMDMLKTGIAQASDPVYVTLRTYLWTDKSQPQESPPLTLTITSFAVQSGVVNMTAGRADFFARPFPFTRYLRSIWPGLDR